MKKYLLLALFLVFLAGCEKGGEKHCWQCNKEITFTGGYSSSVFTVCDMTYEERAAFEQANSGTNGTTKTVTTCRLSI